MRNDTFLAALHATARIACCAALVGLISCDDPKEENTEGESSLESNTDPTTSDDDGDGFSEADGDCNDANASVNPQATESCNGIDDDCDGNIDNDTADATTWYADSDGDGYGSSDSIEACAAPTGYSASTGDCDDNDATLSPADSDDDGFSTCDGDCNDSDATLSPVDSDNDGFSTCDGDCDDSNPDDMVDNDGDGFSLCDGDCDDDNASDLLDGDGDGFSTCDGDCDDSNPDDMVDNDGDGFSLCDGDCDDNASWDMIDYDGDGYTYCTNDCDDYNAYLNPADNDNDGLSGCDGDCDDNDATLQEIGECLPICEDEIESTFSASNPNPNDDTLRCCIMVADDLGYDGLMNYEFSEECCDYIAESGSVSFACTPWGPPTPPAMKTIS